MNTPSIVVVVALSMGALGCGKTKANANAPSSVATSTGGAHDETPVPETPVPATPEKLPNAIVVAGVLTGGQPSPAQYDAMAKDGSKTVISLRTTEEPGASASALGVEALGMTYVSIPIDAPAGLTRENVQKFSDALSEAEGPVVVHCGSGNRVGAMYGLKALWIDGATPADALEIARSSGMTGLEPDVKQLMGIEE